MLLHRENVIAHSSLLSKYMFVKQYKTEKITFLLKTIKIANLHPMKIIIATQVLYQKSNWNDQQIIISVCNKQ